jgi:hypothetical protein
VQVVAGVIEQRILDKFFATNRLVSTTGSFVVRSLNTYLGSAMMIDYLKLVVSLGGGKAAVAGGEPLFRYQTKSLVER